MKIDTKKYMVTVSRKPKGFKWVGNDFYEYDIIFKLESPNTVDFPDSNCYRERITVPYRLVSETHTNRTVDALKLRSIVRKLTGVILGEKDAYVKMELFRRDGALLPFVEAIIVPVDQTEQYIQYRELRDRVTKINKLKDKM